jgi:hypothetical protein
VSKTRITVVQEFLGPLTFKNTVDYPHLVADFAAQRVKAFEIFGQLQEGVVVLVGPGKMESPMYLWNNTYKSLR